MSAANKPIITSIGTILMKNIIALLSCFFITTVTFAIQPTQHKKINPIALGLRKILQQANLTAHIGIIVKSQKTGHIYFSKNENALFMPASIQKLLVSTVAILKLGPNYRFKTYALTNGRIKNGVLYGNLYFDFSGDPTLKTKHLNQMIAKLKSKGIRKIRGNIIIDNTEFNQIPYPPGWVWDDLSYDYAAPLKTIIINQNRFMLHFIPAKKFDWRAKLKTNLPPGTATFINHLATTRKYDEHCPITIYSDDQNRYIVHGCLPKKFGEQRRMLAIRNMLPFTKRLLLQQFKANHLYFTGRLLVGKTPVATYILSMHHSKTLKKIIHHLLKVSDNLYANALLKKIGQVTFKETGSWQDGLHAMEYMLSKHTGIDFSKVHLNDGAGLSRYNLITPKAISEVLTLIQHRRVLRHTIIPALPIAGLDGTLEYRMENLRAKKRLHAKTGSMTSVSSLAGFVRSKNHGLLSFVIIINGFSGERIPYILFENRVSEYLASA